MTEQPRSARQSEFMCYKCNKKGHYASKCHFQQELTCYWCSKTGHYASEYLIKPDTLASCTYCHRKCHRTEYCFVRRSTEAVDKQGVRIFRTSSADESSNNLLPEADKAAAFRRSKASEILRKQQRKQNSIAEYKKPIIRTDCSNKT